MPTSLPRACVYGCQQNGKTCEKHGRKAIAKARDDRRGSAASRGYGSRWREYRSWYLAELLRLDVPRAGLCGARLPGAPLTHDSQCAERGYITVGTVVDHIIPVRGPDDQTFYLPTAHQLLCARCHDAKRQREGQAGDRTPQANVDSDTGHPGA